MPVSVAILNAGGTSIGNGTLKGDSQNCVCLKDLPMGQYFARVFAAGQVQNNYRVENQGDPEHGVRRSARL